MKNGDHAIGLFQGMFDKNILTFNPGWGINAQKLAAFMDVRELQRPLKAQGVQLITKADESTTDPDSFTAADPGRQPDSRGSAPSLVGRFAGITPRAAGQRIDRERALRWNPGCQQTQQQHRDDHAGQYQRIARRA